MNGPKTLKRSSADPVPEGAAETGVPQGDYGSSADPVPEGAAETSRSAARDSANPSCASLFPLEEKKDGVQRVSSAPSGTGSATRKRFLLGVASAGGGALLWGLSGACCQYLFEQAAITSSFITAVRTAVAGVLFLVFILVTQRARFLEMLADGHSRVVLVAFGAGMFGSQITFALSVDATNAGTATVLQSLATVMVMLAVCVRGRRAPRPMEAVGVACAVVATWLIATGGDFGALVVPVDGLLWGLVNALAVTVYIMVPQGLYQRWGSLPVIAAGMVVGMVLGAVLWLAGGLWGDVPAVPVMGLDCWMALVVGVSALGTFVAFGLYLYGCAVVGSVRGSLLGTLEPASAMVLAVVWLGTAMAGADWAGLVLMVAMVFLVALSPEDTSGSSGSSGFSESSADPVPEGAAETSRSAARDSLNPSCASLFPLEEEKDCVQRVSSAPSGAGSAADTVQRVSSAPSGAGSAAGTGNEGEGKTLDA